MASALNYLDTTSACAKALIRRGFAFEALEMWALGLENMRAARSLGANMSSVTLAIERFEKQLQLHGKSVQSDPYRNQPWTNSVLQAKSSKFGSDGDLVEKTLDIEVCKHFDNCL